MCKTGYLNKVHNSNNIEDDEIAILSQLTKHLRQKISNCKKVEKINTVNTERNKILIRFRIKLKNTKKNYLKIIWKQYLTKMNYKRLSFF